MSKSANQKLKLLYLAKIFSEKTDEEHGLTLTELIRLLEQYQVSADRKTLYMDLEELRRFGMDIIKQQSGRSVVYSLASREFELAELKLLVDSVQSARFITEKKSRALIAKLESLASVNEAHMLHRQVIIAGRVKTVNENIYYNVDRIHAAISADKRIRFQYFNWTPDKRMELRRGGEFYEISPWHLIWDDENYYMVGYDPESGMIKHYRVDKMLKIDTVDKPREGSEALSDIDIAQYSRRLFGMLGGEAEKVTLECENYMAGVIIDRFGSETVMYPKDDKHFIAEVDVVAREQFLGWLIGLGRGVKVIAPESIVSNMRQIAADILEYNT